MTHTRVDPFTPTDLLAGYVDEIDHEITAIDDRVEQLRTEWLALEDRRNLVVRLRTRHTEALRTLTPASLHDLVQPEPEEVPTA